MRLEQRTRLNGPGSRRNAPERGASDLDSRYGAIGISAVAAAVRYQSETKSTANAPAASQPASPWSADLAA